MTKTDKPPRKRSYNKHGMTKTRVYEVWKEMHRRCKDKNPRSSSYKAKNIQVCGEWKNSAKFLEWALKSNYREGLQIDRIDNDGGYCEENCRWVTPKENANNRTNTIYLEWEGKKKSLSQWGLELCINPRTLATRVRRGWSIERTLTKPTK